jgi:hypothetical protein
VKSPDQQTGLFFMSTYTLKHPVTVAVGGAEKTFTALTFRRPRGADLIEIEAAARRGNAAAELATITRLADVPFAVGEAMDLKDVEAAAALAGPFFRRPSSPETTSG